MVWTSDAEDLALAVRFLRALRGWTQTRLAREAGMDKSRISLLESGKIAVDRWEMRRLAVAVGLPFDLLELCLPLLRQLRQTLGSSPAAERSEADDWAAASVETMTAKLAIALRAIFTHAVAEICAPEEPRWSYEAGDREGIEELYRFLEPCTQEERFLLVEEGREYRNWALAERLCAESETAAAAGDAGRALHFAETALKIARSLHGPEAWRTHVEGYCQAFLGNAQRAAGQESEAEESYEAAWGLWKEWPPEPGLLQEDRLVALGVDLRGEPA